MHRSFVPRIHHGPYSMLREDTENTDNRETLRLPQALRQQDQWGTVALAALGGYAAALTLWEASHQPILSAYVFQNELPLAARRDLAALLVAGIGLGLIVWLGLGLLAGRRISPQRAFSGAAGVLLLAVPLAFFPVLAIPDLEDTAPFFALACLAGAIVTFALAVRLMSRPLPASPQDSLSASSHPRPDRSLRPVRSPASQDGPSADPQPTSRSGLWLALGLALAYALFMSLLTVARHNAFLTNAFDLGRQDQAIYNILHSGYMRTTLHAAQAINYLGDHFAAIFYLLAPIYALRQDARTLLVLQSLFLAAGAAPLYLLARLKTRSVWLSLALVVVYLLHPALHGVNLDDFHQIAVVVVLLLAALYFLEAGPQDGLRASRDVPFLVSLALALIVKEEVALTVVAIGAYAFLGKRRYRLGAAVALAGLVYFAVVVGWVMPRLGGVPQIDTRFGDFMAPGSDGVSGVAWTLFTNPWFTVLHVFGNQAKLLYLVQVFLPVLFLPLFAPPVAWLVALPGLAVILLTNAPTQYSINYHYSAHLLPSVFFLTALALPRVARDVPARTRALTAALLVSALGMSYLYGQILPRGGPQIPRPAPHDTIAAGFFDEVPRDAVVSTMSAFAPHLTTRRDIYLFPDVADAEYLLLDTGLHANYWPHEGLKARDRSLRDMVPHLTGGQFGVVREEDGVILLKRGYDLAGNADALRVMFSPTLEAEELRSDFDGSVVPDETASGGLARAVTPAQRREDGRSALIFGPYLDLQPGVYRATFVMKVGSRPAERVVTIDVFTHTDGYPRVEREVLGTDFEETGVYQAFTVEFNTSGQILEDVEFRALTDLNTDLSVDRVDIDYLGP